MVKEYTKGLSSDNDKYYLCAFEIMEGDINTVRKLINKLIDIVFKRHY